LHPLPVFSLLPVAAVVVAAAAVFCRHRRAVHRLAQE
jgi:hypothetical protein